MLCDKGRGKCGACLSTVSGAELLCMMAGGCFGTHPWPNCEGLLCRFLQSRDGVERVVVAAFVQYRCQDSVAERGACVWLLSVSDVWVVGLTVGTWRGRGDGAMGRPRLEVG
jgi:hypothetical protein